MTDPHIRNVELEAHARHASERYRLYRARVYGPRPASLTRLRQLEREAILAQRRLQGAKAAQKA